MKNLLKKLLETIHEEILLLKFGKNDKMKDS